MRSKSACGDSFLRIESCFCLRSGRLLGKKNGIPLYPNLVNLKSNTMKNTLQRYDGCFLYASELQEKISECYEFNLNYNFVKVLSCKNGFLLVEDVGREDDGTFLMHPQNRWQETGRGVSNRYSANAQRTRPPLRKPSLFHRACKLGEARFPCFAPAPIRAKVFLLPMKTSFHPAFFSWDA